MSENITSAAAWRQAGTPAEETEVVNLMLPSGVTVKATRPPLDMWLAHGAVPTGLIRKMLSVFAAETEEQRAERQHEVDEAIAVNPETTRRANNFMRDAVMQAVVKPRIVMEADIDNPNEIGLRDVKPTDFNFILLWVLAGSAGVTVKTVNGKGTTLESVETFPDKSRFPGGRKNVRKVRATSKRKARHK